MLTIELQIGQPYIQNASDVVVAAVDVYWRCPQVVINAQLRSQYGPGPRIYCHRGTKMLILEETVKWTKVASSSMSTPELSKCLLNYVGGVM